MKLWAINNLMCCVISTERKCFGEITNVQPVIVGGNNGGSGHVSAMVTITVTALVVAILSAV